MYRRSLLAGTTVVLAGCADSDSSTEPSNDPDDGASDDQTNETSDDQNDEQSNTLNDGSNGEKSNNVIEEDQETVDIEGGQYRAYPLTVDNPITLDYSVTVLEGDPVRVVILPRSEFDRWRDGKSPAWHKIHEDTRGVRDAIDLSEGETILMIDNTQNDNNLRFEVEITITEQ